MDQLAQIQMDRARASAYIDLHNLTEMYFIDRGVLPILLVLRSSIDFDNSRFTLSWYLRLCCR
jgi:hypothetical protein